jgi:rhodanese-related sulfurtransferase
MNRVTKSGWPLILAILAIGLFAFGCSDDDNGGTGPTITETEVISEAAATHLAGVTATMAASALYTTINDGNTANDPFILDVRSTTDFAAGHIAGAVNVPFKDIAKTGNAGIYPADKQIVVVCYTGHTASYAVAWLGTMGYTATALKFGFASWSMDPTYNPSAAGSARPYDVALDCGDYPVSTTASTAGSYTAPEVENTSSDDGSEIIRAAGDVYLNSGASFVTTAVALYTNLNDGNAANDPYILDVRGATDYAAGHLAGAINVAFRTVANSTELPKFDPDRQIVVICYTGHTASQATMVLNMLGYDAIAMKYGMTSWTVDPTKNPSITTNKYFDKNNDCMDYPCATGG